LLGLFQILPQLFKSLGQTSSGQAPNSGANPRTDRDISFRAVCLAILIIIITVGLSPIVPVGLLGAILIALFGFLFASVTSRITGVIGNSNSPASGMTVACLIVTAFLFKLTGNDGPPAMISSLLVGSVICVVCCLSGDTSQDLKTGFILGATPRNQQIGEIVGVVASALVVGSVMLLFHKAWGFGSPELPAPQANLMKLIVSGVMGDQFPRPLVLSGVLLGLVLAVFRLPIMPIAVGLYLPIHLSTPLLAGGLIRYFCVEGNRQKNSFFEAAHEKGVLYSSGLIAGEGVTGLLLAGMAVTGLGWDLVGDAWWGPWLGLLAFGLLGLSLVKAIWGNTFGAHSF
jgi:putative OPT family oligopeptide transporter